jgi:hypothetical protein
MPTAPVDPPSELSKLRFDYAWKWFAYHADQRVKMFNYMLVVVGILANAVVGALEKKYPVGISIGLCAIAALISLIFSKFDRRNRDLVWLGEDILVDLERNAIFGTGNKISGRYQALVDFGILSRQIEQETLIGGGPCHNAAMGKHRFWIPAVCYLIAGLFDAAAILIYCYRQ